MLPEEVGERLARLVTTAAESGERPQAAVVSGGREQPHDGGPRGDSTGVAVSVSGGGRWARATVDVPVRHWHDAVRVAGADAELALDYFDWLSAVDELADGFTVVAHLWSTTRRHGVLLRTRIGRDAPAVPSIVDLFPGAAWHERESHEMFGIDFPGHGELKPLLLPPEFEGHPLRKDFVLATRVAKPWPGAKEPGESEHGGARRQPMRPPGVPDPNEWGPAAGTMPPERERPARPGAAERAARPAAAERTARPAGERPARRAQPPAAEQADPSASSDADSSANADRAAPPAGES
jgi:NADH-quinone oxidoreductase subunit C